MKRIRALFLCGIILFSFAACGNEISDDGVEITDVVAIENDKFDASQDEIEEEYAPESDKKIDLLLREEVDDSNDLEQLEDDLKKGFYIEEISDELFDRIYGKSFKAECIVPREELRYLHLLHKDIDGNTHEGEMIVNKAIAEKTLAIFEELYEADYPIEKIRLVDEYDADDEKSMEDNNTSAFNFRFIAKTNKVSKHGLGMAIDINPLYNPYIKESGDQVFVQPVKGIDYVDRSRDFDYKIDENDLAYKLFTEAGFTWGGSWKTVNDYQHFEME